MRVFQSPIRALANRCPIRSNSPYVVGTTSSGYSRKLLRVHRLNPKNRRRVKTMGSKIFGATKKLYIAGGSHWWHYHIRPTSADGLLTAFAALRYLQNQWDRDDEYLNFYGCKVNSAPLPSPKCSVGALVLKAGSIKRLAPRARIC